MKMTFRWYGSQADPIPLKYVRQIPGMTGLMGLLDKPAGADWPGYGLYDRALGAAYLNGLWEAICRENG